VLDKVAGEGNWGRAMSSGTAQGGALHAEYRSIADPKPASQYRLWLRGPAGNPIQYYAPFATRPWPLP
jgi:hypothetical protein